MITVFIQARHGPITQASCRSRGHISICVEIDFFHPDQSSSDTACPHVFLLIIVKAAKRIDRQRIIVSGNISDHTDGPLLRIIDINSSSICCQPQFTFSFLYIQHDIVIQQISRIQMTSFPSFACISIHPVRICRKPDISGRSQTYARDFFYRNKRNPLQFTRCKMIPPKSVTTANKQYDLFLFIVHIGMCEDGGHPFRPIYR